MAWQPIETAPKDGTRVLLWARAESTNYGYACVIGFHARGEWWTGPVRALDAMHWMPLPEVPE